MVMVISAADPNPSAGAELGPPAPEDIDVQPLASGQWRVCDRRRASNDGLCILGFIEKTDGRFEAMEIGHEQNHAFAWYSFASLIDAVAHFMPAHDSAVEAKQNCAPAQVLATPLESAE